MNTRKRKKRRRGRTRRRLFHGGGGKKYKSENTIEKGIAGYGVFAGKIYRKGQIVETCPFIEIGTEHLQEVGGKKTHRRQEAQVLILPETNSNLAAALNYSDR